MTNADFSQLCEVYELWRQRREKIVVQKKDFQSSQLTECGGQISEEIIPKVDQAQPT
jgi:hypothetical protein